MKFLSLLGAALIVGGIASLEFGVLAPLYSLAAIGAALVLLDALFLPSLLPFSYYYPGRRLATFMGFFALLLSAAIGTLAYRNPLHDVVNDPLHAPKILHRVPVFRVDRGAEFLPESLMLPGAFDPQDSGSGQAHGVEPVNAPLPSLKLQQILARYLPQQPPHPSRVEKLGMEFLYDLLPQPKLVLRDDDARHLEFELEIPVLHVICDLALDVADNPAEPGHSVVRARARTRLPLPDLGWGTFVLQDYSERIQDLAAAPPVADVKPVAKPAEKAKK